MPRYGWRITLIAVAFLTTALGDWNDTSTGINLDELRQFPLSRVRSGWLKDGSRARFDGITATAARDPREVQLRGVGKSGKRWETHMCCLDEVWRADLDGNGTQDYVFFGSGPYVNGRRTPLFSLSILLMDREGIPVRIAQFKKRQPSPAPNFTDGESRKFKAPSGRNICSPGQASRREAALPPSAARVI